MKSKKLLKLITSAASAAAILSASVITAFAEDGASTSTNTSNGGSGITSMIVSLVIMFALLYFLFIRPQKKRDNELKEMQSNLEVGDEIVTSGGIVGIVVRKGDDNVVIETGGERNKIRIKSYAIAENTTALERAKEAQQAKKKAKANLAAGKLTDDTESEQKSKKKAKKEKESE